MITRIIDFFRQTPMYRSMLYFLLTLVAVAAGLSAFGVLPYSAANIVTTSAYLMVVCWASNWVLAKLFGAKPNPESSYITGLILALIFSPMPIVGNLGLLTFLGLAASASKYLLVWKGSHIFNPAALAAVAAAILLGNGASWWVGSIYLLPVVLVGGLYGAYKNNRGHLAFSFLAAYAVFFMVQSLLGGADPAAAGETLWRTLLYSPLLFFVFVMLVEPLTSPARQTQRIYFGVITALAAVALPELMPGVPYTLELSLLAGNVFAALGGRQGRLSLSLHKVEKLGAGITGFWFKAPRTVQFTAGQFLHYTLPHRRADSRGVRRFFTIASSPTEDGVLLVTKFPDKPSSFKRTLETLKVGNEIAASRPEGEFVLPQDDKRPLVFIAGGIGVTPFRSIIKYLLDTGQKRQITLIYAARTEADFVFQRLFDKAKKAMGLQTVYVVDEPAQNSDYQKGPLTSELIKKHSPKDGQALYYLSGPEPMVRAFMPKLRQAGVASRNIKHDYFPGYGRKN